MNTFIGRLTRALGRFLLLLPWVAGTAAGTVEVASLGDNGWYSDDTRTAAGADLVGLHYTHYGKPGQTPTAADDTAIATQIQFVAGPAGSTYGGALLIDGTSGNSGKSTVSVVDVATGFAPASDLVGGAFSATYKWYMQPNPTVRSLAFRLGVRSTQWAASQAGFTALRSGESAWDLILVHVMDSPVANAWNEPSVDRNSGTWYVYGQAGNPNWPGIAGGAPPGGTVGKSLADWQADPTWGPILFGSGAQVVSIQFGLGSSQRQCLAYVDYLQTTILHGGDVVNFTRAIYVDGVAGNDLTGDGSAANPFQTIQKGVATANAGDVVKVLPATYVETGQIVLNKDLTIQGAGADQVVVQTDTDTTAGGNVQSEAWFYIAPGVAVTLSDLTLDGTGQRVNHAIQSRGDLTAQNLVVENVRWGPYNGRGIVLFGGNSGVSNCRLANIERIGVHVRGNVTTPNPVAVISHCEYVGKGSGDWLDYAYEIGGGGQASIEGCTAIHCLGVASSDGSTSAGILATDYWGTGTQATVDNCVVQGCTTGIYVGYASTDATVVSVVNSSLVGNGTGLVSAGALTVTAENNWWGKASGPSELDPDDGTLRTGDGDKVSNQVDFDPWLAAKPAHANALYLVPTDASIYLQPGESILVDMNVANLLQPVNSVQAMLGYSSAYFADPTGGAVAPGSSIWQDVIWDSWRDSGGTAGEIDTAIGVHAEGGGGGAGTTADDTVAKITLTSRTGVEGITQMVFRPDADPDPGLVESTFFSDLAAQPVWPAKVNSANIYIDGTAPAIGTVTATENVPYLLAPIDVKDCANTAYQGTVEITVQASDALAGLVGQPAIVLTHSSAAPQSATYVNETPAGTFNYTWAIGSGTANGTWTAHVTATDKAGNFTTVTFTLCVNKNQIVGNVQQQGYVGGSRTVTFVTTGTTVKTWNLILTFTGNTASYILTDVPDGTVAVSAKTAWHLRNKLPAVLDGDGQASASFTGAEWLLGGDLNGSNSINVLDYSILKVNWLTSAPQADVTGDGNVNVADYTLMKLNWFKLGDPQ